MNVLKPSKTINILVVFLLFFAPIAKAQKTNILFYNVENLFDTLNDSITQDDEFTPNGLKHWTPYRYTEKLSHISRVIYESGGFNIPVFIGLAEVENRNVLEDLVNRSGLVNLGYNIIHFDSQDARGIDVGILYCRNKFKVDSVQKIPVVFDANSRPTRDILHVSGWMSDSAYYHFYVNHWPSRYGGVAESMHKRMKASVVLSEQIKYVLKQDSCANIIVMGDFNDNTDDKSILHLMTECALMNKSQSARGTLKHQHQWYSFDQMLTSGSLSHASLKVIDFDYLLQKDNKNTGYKLFRTYEGYKYTGGYSDHLPIMLTLQTH